MHKKPLACASIILLFSAVALALSAASVEANFTPPPYPHMVIKSDGGITPLTVPIQRNGEVYSLTANITRYVLEVKRDNIIIDGAGHSLSGNSHESGIVLVNRNNVAIRNTEIIGFGQAIYLSNSSNNLITANAMKNTGTGSGIRLANQSRNNVILDNFLYFNHDGVAFFNSGNNTLRKNTILWGRQSINVDTDAKSPLSSYINDVDASNTVNGKPIYYWVNQHDRTVPEDAGYVALINCTRITVQNLNVSDRCESGILLIATTDSLITRNTATYNTNGITLAYGAEHNVVSENTITRNENAAILVREAHDNEFIANNITGEGAFGNRLGLQFINSQRNIVVGNTLSNNWDANIKLENSAATITRNRLTNSTDGIWLVSSADSLINENTIMDNRDGIAVADSSRNTIVANNITENWNWGIRLTGSQKDNVVYRNNFIDNQIGEFLQASMPGYGQANVANPSTWDKDGEGNYWSDYLERYTNGSEVGNSGIGDTAFIINENNVDHYPLIAPYLSPEPSALPMLAMPEESLNYTVTALNGSLWAQIDGVYPMHFSGGGVEALPMVYPTPPDTSNMHIWLDDAELSWSNYSDVDPAARHRTDLGDWIMIFCVVNPESTDFVLRIHYEHPVQVINGTHMFLYDLNISPYLSPSSPKSTAHFRVRLEVNCSGVEVFTSGFNGTWSPMNYTSVADGDAETVTFDIVSEYGKPLLGDIVVTVANPEVPEFPPWAIAFLFAAVMLAAVVVFRKKPLRKP